MENKEKILKLINSCIENKTFYNHNNKERHCINHQDWDYEKRNKEIKFSHSDGSDKIYDVSTESRLKYENELTQKFEYEVIKVPNFIVINFDETPPIEIGYMKKEGDIRKLHDKLFLSREDFIHTEEVENFWGKKKTIERSHKKEIILSVNEIALTYVGQITLGKLKIEITLDEFREISKKIKENKVKFAQVKYTDILDDRLKRYC